MKILFLMMKTGSGHIMPAKSISSKMNAETIIVDPAREFDCGKTSDCYENIWKFMLKWPILYHLSFYVLMTRLGAFFESFATVNIQKRLGSYIDNIDPDCIVTTHNAYARMLSKLKKRKRLKKPTFVFATDTVNPHEGWLFKENNYLLLFHLDEKRKKTLLKRGFAKEQIIHVNFPLRPEFQAKSIDTKCMRKTLTLKDTFTVTILSGGEGIGRIQEFVQPFIDNDDDIQVNVVCGRNEKLKLKLDELSIKSHCKNLTLNTFGFISNMSDYIHATDLMLGKSGISFMFESLLCKKPIIINQTFDNEKPCMNYLIEKGVCLFRTDPGQVHKDVIKLRDNKSAYAKMVRNIETINIQNGSKEIADFIATKTRDFANPSPPSRSRSHVERGDPYEEGFSQG
jgi:processive 1,2-diacylglycerol beta-glucosyltransferase